MSFYEQVGTARALLERNGRVSLRCLQRELQLDDDALEERVEELVDVQLVARREDKVLVWAGPAAVVAPARATRPAPSRLTATGERAPLSCTPEAPGRQDPAVALGTRG